MNAPPGRSLKRSMRLIGVLFLTLSAVTPASSVFVIVPGVFQQAGTGAFLSMAVAALVSTTVACVYAELSSAFPIAGGEYCLVGKTLDGTTAFVTLALTAVGNMLGPAVLSLGAATYIKVLVPDLDARAVGIAIIVITTLLGVLHVRTNAWITGVFLSIELLALFLLAVLGFAHIHTPFSALVFHPQILKGDTLASSTLSMIGLSTAVSFFAYNGYGSAVYFAEEMHDAPRLVARAIMWSLLITVLTELVPVTAVLMGAPDGKTLLRSDSPFSYFVLATGGQFLNIAVSLGIALAIFNAVLATVMQNGRFFFSTGRDGTWHPRINDAFTLTHSRFNSPWIATLASGASAIIMCFFDLKLLLVLTGTGIVFIYALLCVGALAGRYTGTTAHAAYRMPLFPLTPIVAVLCLGVVIVLSWFDESNGRPSLIANVVIVLVAIAYYRFVLHRGGWTLHGPDEPLEPATEPYPSI